MFFCLRETPIGASNHSGAFHLNETVRKKSFPWIYMSSNLATISQLIHCKRWVVGTGGGNLVKYQPNTADLDVNVTISLAARTILRDMGKPVLLSDGTLLQKLQVIPVLSNVSGSGATGYLVIQSPTGAPSNQNITVLN